MDTIPDLERSETLPGPHALNEHFISNMNLKDCFAPRNNSSNGMSKHDHHWNCFDSRYSNIILLGNAFQYGMS